MRHQRILRDSAKYLKEYFPRNTINTGIELKELFQNMLLNHSILTL